jgi:Fe-Mn family superoxide dismutase
MVEHGQASGEDPEFAELTRRLGFEYNGMILHEHYFSNLCPAGAPTPPNGSPLAAGLTESFGSVEQWQSAFHAIGEMRGVGWVILFEDPATHWLTNHWVALHHEAFPRASGLSSSWMCGSTPSCGTTKRRNEPNTSRPSSGTSTGE